MYTDWANLIAVIIMAALMAIPIYGILVFAHWVFTRNTDGR